jgi:hypothetical protein
MHVEVLLEILKGSCQWGKLTSYDNIKIGLRQKGFENMK